MISELLSRAGGYNGQDIYGYISGNCMWCVNRKETHIGKNCLLFIQIVFSFKLFFQLPNIRNNYT